MRKRFRKWLIRRLGCVAVWWKDYLPISADDLQVVSYEIRLIDKEHVRISAEFETGITLEGKQ